MADEINQVQTEEEKTPLIWVTATGEPDGQVILWERDPRHPAPEGKQGITTKPNEAFIVRDGQGYHVAETARVKQLIGEGALQRVNWNSKQPPKNGGKGPSTPIQPATGKMTDLPDDEPSTPLTPASTTFGKPQVKK